MRYVSSIPPPITAPNTSLVQGLKGAHAVKPVHARESVAAEFSNPPAAQQALPAVSHEEHRQAPSEERRIACRRIHQQKVLIELRSGVERRHHSLREGDVIEHIDETA